MTINTENFNGTDATVLSTHQPAWATSSTSPRIYSPAGEGYVRAHNTAHNAGLYTGTYSSESDTTLVQYSEAKIPAMDAGAAAGSYAGVVIRMIASAGNGGYEVRAHPNTRYLRLIKLSGSWGSLTATILASDLSGTAFNVGDTIQIRGYWNGSTNVLSAWVDSGSGFVKNATIGDYSDASWTHGGEPGIHFSVSATSDIYLDDWEGGDFVAATTVIPLTSRLTAMSGGMIDLT